LDDKGKDKMYDLNETEFKAFGTDIPEDMIKFVEERCKDYQPHAVFAMDIAETRHDDGTMRYYKKGVGNKY
jgi:hypothetical protein